jgi:hypothetical protein
VTEHAVVIAGGGPTGLMLAGELALAGVDVAIVERRASQDLAGSRAGGLHSRTIEVLDQRGIADRFLSAGQVAQVGQFSGVRLDISDFPTRHPYSLGLWQNHIERILAGWVGELAVPIYRGREVTGFAQDDTGVDVELSDGQSLRAEYLAGCDGGRSLIRKAAGIEFPGWDPTVSWMIAEVEMSSEPPLGMRQDAAGIHGLGRTEYERKHFEASLGFTVHAFLLLNDGDSLNVGSSILLFRRLPAPPLFRGKPCAEIPLRNVSRLCFGRVAEAGLEGEELVLLDSEDRRISRRLVLLWRQATNFLVRDESPTGTFLNGQRFESHQLVVGDRFQISGYSFEFTGISLRRTRPRIGGKVEALGVWVSCRRADDSQRNHPAYRAVLLFRNTRRKRSGEVHFAQRAVRDKSRDDWHCAHRRTIDR